MKISNEVVFITGANRGLGLAFAREAVARGARKVYAAARRPEDVVLPGVVPVQLDVTDPGQIDAAVRACGDVSVLVNNAGIGTNGGFLADDSVEKARALMDTNFFGPLRISAAFAPVLARQGGGAILNVLSLSSWVTRPVVGLYAASKAAAWSLTNGLRHELSEQGTQVLGLHVAWVDTDMTSGFDVPKTSAIDVVRAAFDGLEAGASEVLADELSRQVHRNLSGSPAVYLLAR
jgi:NAD(P)-dependent dehydrogenase (short-subunit alcohol dehydrogenase family)